MWDFKPFTLLGIVLLGTGLVVHLVGSMILKDRETKQVGNGIMIFGGALILLGAA